VVICEIKLFCNNFEIIDFSVLFHITAVSCEITHWYYFRIISVFYFACNHVWDYFKIISAAEFISKLFQRHWTCCKIFV